MIPQFPEFAPIALEHKAEVDAVLAPLAPLASEYTFTNLYAWSGAHRFTLARFGDGLLIRKGDTAFLQPLVPGDGREAVTACLEAGGRIERVGEDFVTRTNLDGLQITEDPDNFDYVYSVPELSELRGAKYHDKKNLLNQFERNYRYTYRTMTPEIVDQCLGFQHEWCEERECDKDESLLREHCAVHRMLRHFSELNLHGGVIEIDGQIVALTLGEALNPDTFVIHIEKGKGRLTGIYQAINRDFLRDAAAGYPYVNREQDLGIPGLRKAKQSYNPVRMVKKYTIG